MTFKDKLFKLHRLKKHAFFKKSDCFFNVNHSKEIIYRKISKNMRKNNQI